jgi:hypothetical protein
MQPQSKSPNHAATTSGSARVTAALSDESVEILDRRLVEIIGRARHEIEQLLAQLQSDDRAVSAAPRRELAVLLQLRQELEPSKGPMNSPRSSASVNDDTVPAEAVSASDELQMDLLAPIGNQDT